MNIASILAVVLPGPNEYASATQAPKRFETGMMND
jgi:hypothetical protein